MPACPNCGRRALRTKDWACQWCGYPLLYGNFKQIDKTYKELQEERNPSYRAEEPEPEIEPVYESEPEPVKEIEREPAWKLRRTPKPARKPEPEPEPESEVETAPEPEPEVKPKPVSVPEVRSVAIMPSEPPAQPVPEQIKKPATEPMSQPLTPPEPQPAPVPAPSPASITDGTVLTVDQLNELFQKDRASLSAMLKDKTLVLQGLVGKIFIRDHIDVRYIILGGAKRAVWEVRCGFNKDQIQPMNHLREGQPAVVRGKYDGFGKNIIFKDCELVG